MANDDNPSIKIMPDGSFKAKGITSIKILPSGESLEIPRGKILLCGCGNSNTMPRCDGSHTKIGYKSEKKDERIPTNDRNYFGKEITVHFDLAVCAHVGYCVKGLPEVFDVKKRPWVNPDMGKTEEIVRIVRSCPAGALSYTLKDKERVDSFESKKEIIYHKNGPYELWGDITIEGAELPKVPDHYTLCSCGKSKNHPYCDGMHLKKTK